jgi:uncharacterized membrane protein (GlpM family)
MRSKQKDGGVIIKFAQISSLFFLILRYLIKEERFLINAFLPLLSSYSFIRRGGVAKKKLIKKLNGRLVLGQISCIMDFNNNNKSIYKKHLPRVFYLFIDIVV